MSPVITLFLQFTLFTIYTQWRLSEWIPELKASWTFVLVLCTANMKYTDKNMYINVCVFCNLEKIHKT